MLRNTSTNIKSCDNQLFSTGFRKKCSFETQFLLTIQEIAFSIVKGNQAEIIWLNFSIAKMFDKVPHSRLLYKLEYYGVRDNTRKWIESFLGHRGQQVILDGIKSDTVNVISGIPQWTAMRPPLFLLLQQGPEPELFLSSDTKQTGDDSMVYKVIENDTDRELQRDLSALKLWEESW